MELSAEEFSLLRRYIHDLCGLAIPDDKSYLIQQRLEPLVVANGCKGFSEFYQKLKQSPPVKIQEQIINAITTNETSFFRDEHPFVAIEEYILPKLGEMTRERKARDSSRKGPKVSLWCAGASTGQEPYSLAILVHEYATTHRHHDIATKDFGLLATDISNDTLSRALAGRYSEMEVKRGVSEDRMANYFTQEGRHWIVNSSIRSMVEFRQVNLVKPFAWLGGFDLILCRNVLIYFDNGTKVGIIDQFYDMLSEDGFLVLGASEHLYGVTKKFKSLHHGDTLIYIKNPRNPVHP